MGKKPRQWSPDGLKYLVIINPFGWRNPPDGSSRNVNPGHLIAWINHALGHQEGDSVVQELAWRAKTGTREALLAGINESVDIKDLLGEHRWSEFCRSLTRPDSSYIFETKYKSLVHACRADSWKRVESDLQLASVKNMFEKPYPRPRWADSRKQCAGMNAQVLAQVKAMQTLPQTELRDAKPEPSVSHSPLVSVLRPSETIDNRHGLSRPAYTDLMSPTSARTSQAKAETWENQHVSGVTLGPPSHTSALVDQHGSASQAPEGRRVGLSPQDVSSQEYTYVKQEPSENLVHSSINVHQLRVADVYTSVSNAQGPENGHEQSASLGPDAIAGVPEPRVKMEASEGSVASVERMTAGYAAYLDRRAAAHTSIPTAAHIQTPFPPPRSAQVQPRHRFHTDVRLPTSTPETPTTHVRAEPLGPTVEPAPPASANPLGSVVSMNLSSSLPAVQPEPLPTAALPFPSITGLEPLPAPERSNRFSVKVEPIAPLTDLAAPVARSGTSAVTARHGEPQGTSINATASLNPKGESGIDDESTIWNLSIPSSVLNKRKSTSTDDRDRQSKRAKLDDSSH